MDTRRHTTGRQAKRSATSLSADPGRRGIVSFEAPLLVWAVSADRTSFDIEESWQELSKTACVTRDGAAYRMSDVNDLVDAVEVLVSLGIAEYDPRHRRVRFHRARVDALFGALLAEMIENRTRTTDNPVRA